MMEIYEYLNVLNSSKISPLYPASGSEPPLADHPFYSVLVLPLAV
jgi:hypothetical protein